MSGRKTDPRALIRVYEDMHPERKKIVTPLVLPDGVIYPDFTVPNLRTRMIFYWEHEGMLDNPGYGERMVRKNIRYTRAGIYPGEQLIMSMESSEHPLSTKDIEALIFKYLL